MWLVLFNEFLFSLRCSFTWSATLICNGSSSTPVWGSKKLAASWASDVLAINLSCAQKSDLACIKAVLGRISKWFLNSAGISNVILNAALALLFYSLFLRKFWWITKTTNVCVLYLLCTRITSWYNLSYMQIFKSILTFSIEMGTSMAVALEFIWILLRKRFLFLPINEFNYLFRILGLNPRLQIE